MHRFRHDFVILKFILSIAPVFSVINFKKKSKNSGYRIGEIDMIQYDRMSCMASMTVHAMQVSERGTLKEVHNK